MPRILSGVYEDKTTGAPLCAVIDNRNTRSGDYANLKNRPRPGHADFTGFVRYDGFNDPRGGGHFSGRITAPLVFCGALVRQILRRQGIVVGGHIAAIAGVEDRRFDPVSVAPEELDGLQAMALPLLDPGVEGAMRSAVAAAREGGDSVGGLVECAVCGLPAGVGNPFFDSLESVLAHLLFSIPAVKGVEFGDGFSLAGMRGSGANHPYCIEAGRVRTRTNHNGGESLGGITNGMPVVFRVSRSSRPLPSPGNRPPCCWGRWSRRPSPSRGGMIPASPSVPFRWWRRRRPWPCMKSAALTPRLPRPDHGACAPVLLCHQDV